MQNRRDFLKKAGIGTAAVISMPTILTSCSHWRGANDRVYIAHIGTGSRGTEELKYYFLPQDRFRCVATCDVFKDRREKAANTIKSHYEDKNISIKDIKSYNNYQDLLERKDIDAVAITTCDHWHLPIAIEAARAGKHIHVNKPLGLNYEYMMELRKIMRKKKLKFNYGTQQRSYDFLTKAIGLIQEGRIGKVNKVLVWAPGGLGRKIAYFKKEEIPAGLDYDRWLGPAPEAAYTADRVARDGSFFINDYSIGFLGGWGAHPLDVMVWAIKPQLTGEYTIQGKGEARWPETSMYDNINVWDCKLKYKNGLEVRFMNREDASPIVHQYQKNFRENGTLFFGEKGWISLSRSNAESNIPEIHEMFSKFPTNKWGPVGDTGTHGLNFANTILENTPEKAPLDDAILSDLISHMSDISIRLNKEITWDPVKGEILENTEANKLLNRIHRGKYAVL